MPITKVMTWQLPFGSRKRSESGSTQHQRKRTRQAMVLVCAGTLLVALLGVGAWQMLGPSADGEGSLQVLASNAIEAATDMSAALRENVTRDASRLAELIRGPEEEEVGENADEAEAAADPKAVAAAPSAPRVASKVPPPKLAPAPMMRTGSSVIAAAPDLPPLPGLFDFDTPGITPPGTENIRLHSLDSESVPAEGPNLVEVIVSPYGQVERAKLISAPADIHEAMILSAIKAWQFTPALKDGHPVRYRLILPVDVALNGKVLITRESDVPSP